MAAAPAESPALTPQERLLRLALRIFAVCSAAETLVYLLPALIGSSQGWAQLPFVAGSFVKAGMLAGLCFVAAADVRRYERLVSVLVAALALWSVAGAAMLVWGEIDRPVAVLGIETSIQTIVWGGILFEGGLAVLYAILHRRAYRSRYGISYLSVGQFRTLAALGESVLGPEASTLSPERVAMNVEAYLQRFDARRKWVIRLALSGINLYPLLVLRQPFNLMAADERRVFLERRFRGDVARRRIGSLRRWLVQGMIRIAQQIVYLGYYGDPATWEEVGYVPFSGRPGFDPSLRKRPGGLEVERGPRLRSDVVEAEVAIVGSGAAAGVIAHRLVADGRRVVMVERGRHEDPADFTEDEAEMLARLYRDGAVQLARDFRLQVLQGMCVGGTTVINNAVSIPTPPEVLSEWNERCGGAFEGFERDIDAISELLEIKTQPEDVFSAGVGKFVEGVERMELREGARMFEPVAANIRDCLGCGYCNIGCAYGRKLSMLDTLLPQAQAMDGPGSLRIVSECEAEGIDTVGARVDGISCRANGRRVRVRADRYVVAAGAVSSSYLLGRSGVGGSAVGQGLGFNVGSPITAEFDERLDTYAGLQITHVYRPRGAPEYVMETWFNPVLSQALAMPGWFGDHRRNMLRYAHMAATGVIVGTASTARVEKALFGGADVVYTPEQTDLERLLAGLKLAGRIYLKAGAKRVMPATFEYHSFTSPEQLDRLDEIVKDSSDIQLGTGHPQGGNALGTDPASSVVDPHTFRVHGTDNLYLCDASAFPTTIGVNPQLTVMALANRAAPLISAGT
ncbi:MAG: GMC family oxidoreductase N-terminal domain-containing protein [Solirubrobacterales bacterium]